VGNSSGGETCGGALHMIDMEDPRNPTFAGCFQPPGPGGRAVGTHDTQCVTYHGPDDRYTGREICFSSNGAAFSIGDVTDKRNPVPVALATYPNLAYTHQGWLDEEQRYFYMNDEGDEDGGLVEGTRTLVWDIQDLEDPILVTEYVTDSPATDHNLYIVGDVMYQSNYRSGLRVVDISEREAPTALGYFDTVPWGADDGMGDIVSGAIGSWSNYPFFASGIVAVSSSKEGLFLVRLRTVPGADVP
jgi:choice-of-anchor B domain-containing protein